MTQANTKSDNTLLLQAAMLAVIISLLVAWTLAFTKAFPIPFVEGAIKDYDRLIQAHIDFLLMAALLLGFYGARVRLPWHVCWAMAIGAFTNSSAFVYLAFYPTGFTVVYKTVLMLSFLIASYGFGKGALTVLRSTCGGRSGS